MTTAIVAAMAVALLISFVVITIFAQQDDDWTTNRPGRTDPDESTLGDLLDP